MSGHPARPPGDEAENVVEAVEIVAAAILVSMVLAASVATLWQQNAQKLVAIAGVLLLAVMAVHRGDAALLDAVGRLLTP
ncbi:hypothetical protein [Amycolatopsis sp. NPDC004079]|uniref:hypothetical protein n=1 Tax=Amycolatopsis sp. NPDC004079 TaxID=3154549 RepID=UPI0033B5E374